MGHYNRYDMNVEIPEAKEKKLCRSNMWLYSSGQYFKTKKH